MRARSFLAAASLFWSCAAVSCSSARLERLPPAKAPPPTARAEQPPAALARTARCAATPSTVYGDEPVVFIVEGDGPPGARAKVEVKDQRERVVLVDSVQVPGQLRIASLQSGDFLLTVVGSAVRCSVTVNRELSRASPAVP